MGKEYKLPDSLYAKRVAPLVKDYELVFIDGKRTGRVTLACGHVRLMPNVLTPPAHASRILCPICTGQAERGPKYTQKHQQHLNKKRWR